MQRSGWKTLQLIRVRVGHQLNETISREMTQGNETMQCILASDFGRADNVLSKGTLPIPTLDAKNKKQLLVKVHACSLTPGDYRMLHGDVKFIKKPKKGFPYIPGLDVSATVVATNDTTDAEFKVGDEVVGTWDVFGEGGMAEYALVDKLRTVHRPSSVDKYEGAALANSSAHALRAVRESGVGEGSRLLVLGGTGGVGMSCILLARALGVSFIAATATDTEMLKRLGVDLCINYKDDTTHWSDAVAECEGGKVDAIIDCAEGVKAWTHVNLLKAIEPSGKFVAVVFDKSWDMKLSSHFGIIGFLAKPLGRMIASRTYQRKRMPAYVVHLNGPDKKTMKEVMQFAQDGKLNIELHENKTFEFSEQGAKDAFNLLYSHRAHGKIVMKISQD